MLACVVWPEVGHCIVTSDQVRLVSTILFCSFGYHFYKTSVNQFRSSLCSCVCQEAVSLDHTNQTQSSGQHLCLMYMRSQVQISAHSIAIVTEIFHGFLQNLCADTGIVCVRMACPLLSVSLAVLYSRMYCLTED